MDNFGLERELLARVVDVINSFHPVDKIIIFGSRATGSFNDTSDIDLALFSPDLPDSTLGLIRNALEEQISTPLKFDILNFYRIDKESLKSSIAKEGVVIYESKKD